MGWKEGKDRRKKKKMATATVPQGASHSIFFAPLLSDLHCSTSLQLLSISLNHLPRGNSSATPTHDCRKRRQKVELILGLDDGSAFAVLHPSIRPPCVLHSPASVLRTTQPEFPRPTRRQRGLASGRNRGTRRGRDNSSGRYLALLLRSRCLEITDLRHRISPRANTKREGGDIPGPCFCCRRSTPQKHFGLCFWSHRLFFLFE